MALGGEVAVLPAQGDVAPGHQTAGHAGARQKRSTAIPGPQQQAGLRPPGLQDS